MKNKIKTIFISSGDFGINILDELNKLDYIEIILLITQPDKPTGRKQILTPPPVKNYVFKNNLQIKIIQPVSIKLNAQEILDKYNPELIIVASYGQIIPKKFINFPKHGSLNFHGSLLPLLRGATPVPMSILNGFSETGVSLQKMVFEMDAGAIISSRKIALDNEITTDILMNKLSTLAAEIVKEDLKLWIEGKIEAKQQDSLQATYCYKEDINKQNAEIKFNTGVKIAERMIRSFYPWPVSWIRLKDGKTLKIFKATENNDLKNKFNVSGFFKNQEIEIVTINKKMYLILQNGLLELQEVQLEGKLRNKVDNYLYLGKKIFLD